MASVLKHDILRKGTEFATPVAFNVEDVQSRARVYLEEIQKEAEQVLANAQLEAKRLQVEAMKKGAADAEAEFEQRVQKAAEKLSDVRCRTAIAACESTMLNLTTDTTQWLAIWRNQTVELATKIAEKIIRRQLQDHDEVLRVWLEEALVALRDVRDVRVLVHPDDFAVAGRFLQHLAKSLPQAASAEVIPDPDVKLGGCIVRSNHGLIDQQLETQLQRLVDQLS